MIAVGTSFLLYPVSPSVGDLQAPRASHNYSKAANAGHGSEIIHLDGEEGSQQFLQLCCAAGWYN